MLGTLALQHRLSQQATTPSMVRALASEMLRSLPSRSVCSRAQPPLRGDHVRSNRCGSSGLFLPRGAEHCDATGRHSFGRMGRCEDMAPSWAALMRLFERGIGVACMRCHGCEQTHMLWWRHLALYVCECVHLAVCVGPGEPSTCDSHIVFADMCRSHCVPSPCRRCSAMVTSVCPRNSIRLILHGSGRAVAPIGRLSMLLSPVVLGPTGRLLCLWPVAALDGPHSPIRCQRRGRLWANAPSC